MAALTAPTTHQLSVVGTAVNGVEARTLLASVMGGADDARTLQAADALLQTFGGVRGVAQAWPEDLARVPGVGPAQAAAVAAAFRLAPLASLPEAPVCIWTARHVARIAQPLLAPLPREQTIVLVADAAYQLRHTEIVAVGGLDYATVSTREILNCVLRWDGRYFAIAHNHPSGAAAIPSRADTEVTERVRAGARLVGLGFLCHVVVARGGWAEVPASTRLAEVFAAATGVDLETLLPSTGDAHLHTDVVE